MRGNHWTPVLAIIAAGLLGTLPANAQWNGGARLPRNLHATQPSNPNSSNAVTAKDDDIYPPMDPHLAAYQADGMPVPPMPPMMGETIPSPSDSPATLPSPSGTLTAPGKCEACEQAAHGTGGCPTCESGKCDSCEKGCAFSFGLGGSCGCPLDCPDACPQCKLFDDCCWLKEHCLTAEGYFDLGYTADGWGHNATWNGPVGFNDRADELQMNQAYFYLEKATKAGDCDWDFGGRIDFLYGTDARWVESGGLERTVDGHEKWFGSNRFYHLALVQAYGEAAYGDWKVKLGKFITPMEYEVIDSRANFFYSHSYGFLYGVMYTHTGVLATQTVNENLNWSVGLSSGVDNFFDNQGRVNFIGSVNWTSCDKNTNIVFSLCTGDEPNFLGDVPAGTESNQTTYSLTWVQKINDRLTYVFQHDLGVWVNATDPTDDNSTARTGNAAWYGITNYLTYQLNCDWWLGARAEWFRDRDGARVIPVGDSLNVAGGGSNAATTAEFEGDFYECTVGLNYKPLSSPNLVVRPEFRWDTYTGEGHPFDRGTKNNQFLFAIDALIKF